MPDLDAERRARIGRRHALAAEARADDPVGAARAVVCLHGTDPTSVFLAVWARTRGGDVAAVERTLYEDRSLVRVLAMRRTLFVAPHEVARVLLVACSARVAAEERRRLLAVVQEDERWLAEVEDVAVAMLERLGEATAAELCETDERLARELILAPGTRYEAKQRLASRVLTVLGAQGRAVRAHPRGSWTSTQFGWSTPAGWLGEELELGEPDAARAELARMYLHAFGPARIEDLKWWTGWPLGMTRAAVAAIDTTELSEGLLVLADDAGNVEPAAPWAALLPALDSTTMGWKERAFYLGGHGPALFDVNGNASPTVWWNGRVVGGWAQAPGGEIRYELLDDPGADARAAIEAAAAAAAARVGGARLSPRARGRSPVEKRLLA